MDSLTAAGYPSAKDDPIPDDWRNVLVQDLEDRHRPFLKSDGYYVSKTSLCDDAATSDAQPGEYIDASNLAYIVMPQFWLDRLGMGLGDLCLLWRHGSEEKDVAIIGDVCPVDEPLGEMSIAAAKAFGGERVSPRDGVDIRGSADICCVMLRDRGRNSSGRSPRPSCSRSRTVSSSGWEDSRSGRPRLV